MNKAFLVALREYMENLRTKAFWIGILAFPVILALMIIVPILLEKEKDVRHYAVYDKSGFLLDAVESRAALPDLNKVFVWTKEKYDEEDEDFETLPAFLQQSAPTLSSLSHEAIEEFSALVARLYGPEGDQVSQLLSQISDEQIDAQFAAFGYEEITASKIRGMLDGLDEIKDWWQNLPPEDAEKFGSGISKSRYKRIDVDLTGVDPEETLKKMLSDDKIFAYFVIGDDPVGTPASKLAGSGGDDPGLTAESDLGKCKYVSNNLTDDDLLNWFRRYANAEVSSRRIAAAEIDAVDAKWIQRNVHFEAKQISETGEEEEVEKQDELREWAPVAFVYLLWISVFTITQMLLTNTIEEKSNKIMEVLLSSVSPIQLMAGKIAGIAGTGLTMVISWIVFFFAGIKLIPVFMDRAPEIDLALIARDPIYLASFVAYFILGYLLLSAILVGIGSVCNSLKEAQNLMTPVTILLIVPLVAMVPIGKDPNGTIAKVLSYIPPFTPFVMMNRAAGPPSVMEYVITTILLLISIVLALWAAAKVFRIGILLTGKAPKPSEILKWIRAPVGQIPERDKE